MLSRTISSILFAALLVCQVGCVDDDASTKLRNLNNQLNRLVLQFENAESNFGGSTSSDALVQNAHWLDRMINYNNEIAKIEKMAIALGADPITDLRRELDTRIAGHIQTIQSDMQYVDAMTQMEIAKIWLEM